MLYCKVCTKEKKRKYDIASGRRKPAGWERKTADKSAYMRAYTRDNRDRANGHKRQWLKNNPERAKCRDKTRWAIYSGKLKKEPCAICGELDVDAHHPDYSQPLDVIWLCRPHHQEIHKKTVPLGVRFERASENTDST